jgi:hypothetical protein
MSGNLTIANTFAAQTGPIPLSQLDTNFTAVASSVNAAASYSNYYVDSSGVANTITVTIAAPATFSYTAGVRLQVLLANTNTSSTVNINVNALGNIRVVTPSGIPLSVGLLITGNVIDVIYNGASNQFVLLNQQPNIAGSFTGTLTGFTVAPTGTVYYVQQGYVTTLYAPSSIVSGLSNATALTMTGLPAGLVPANNVGGTCLVYDGSANTNPSFGAWSIGSGSSVIVFSCSNVSGSGVYASSSAFVSSPGHNKGVASGVFAIYSTV